jgi:hypothetical protein
LVGFRRHDAEKSQPVDIARIDEQLRKRGAGRPSAEMGPDGPIKPQGKTKEILGQMVGFSGTFRLCHVAKLPCNHPLNNVWMVTLKFGNTV